jgi:uroporphyrin-3 C-methyltransferase
VTENNKRDGASEARHEDGREDDREERREESRGEGREEGREEHREDSVEKSTGARQQGDDDAAPAAEGDEQSAQAPAGGAVNPQQEAAAESPAQDDPIAVARAAAREAVAAKAGGADRPAEADAGIGASSPPAPPPAPSAGPAPGRGLATPIAWLALILVLVLAAGGVFQLLELQRREADLLQRVRGLESSSGQDTTTFDQMRDNLARQIELELEGIEARQQRAEEDQQRAVDRLESQLAQRSEAIRRDLGGELSSLQASLQQQEEALRQQQQLVSDLSVEDRQSWQLAEVQYLLRLANQRLIMTGDTQSAEALLRSADRILRDMEDTGLMKLREAVASDLAAVRSVPKLDMEGLYLQLEALIHQTDALVLFELPDRAPEVEAAPAEDWRGRLSQGVDAAVDKLSEYIVVSRRDTPIEALMDPQYESLVRQNMRMLLEQAQVAMVSGNEVLYRQSLERASGWVAQFFKDDQQAAKVMAEELARLRDERVSVDLPDLSSSLAALDAVMDARLSNGGS